MKRTVLIITLLILGLALAGIALAQDDPFAAGADALAVEESDGSSSLRAKVKLKKMAKDMVLVQVLGIDDSGFPNCVMTAKVLKAAKKSALKKIKHLKLIGRGKVYKFVPVYKMKEKQVDLAVPMNQNNLGACYFPKDTKLVLKVSGVDLKAKVFKAAEIYVRQ